MSSDDSVTGWLEGLKSGESAAAQAICQRFFPRLISIARQRLPPNLRRAADEEDVALSAMYSFFRAAEQGRLPDLADRHDLWRLLLRITARKAIDALRHETRQRRGGGRVLGESGLASLKSDEAPDGLAEVMGDDPTPAFAVTMVEECRRLLEMLDADLQAVAVAKMQGYQNEEIAQQLGWSVRTVERRLQLIRKKWQREAGL
jgi:DNA-directed RNA polymerase specialized sigma24 family protein